MHAGYTYPIHRADRLSQPLYLVGDTRPSPPRVEDLTFAVE